MNSANIKPSVAFMSMGRADYKQIKYTDEQDGPSSMQMIVCDKTAKDKDPASKNVFEQERDHHDAVKNDKIQM